jgi:hypothetical protein
MPLRDIHFELMKSSYLGAGSAAFSATVPVQRNEQRASLRLRLGRALIASGRALAGATAEHSIGQRTRPVSAQR